MKRVKALALASALLLMGGCGGDPPPAATTPTGAVLFGSTAIASSSLDLFSCATCHDTTAASSTLIKPGAPLAGAPQRPSFWGGQENDLLSSINDCLTYFMDAGAPLAAKDPKADALYAYLTSLGPGSSDPVPFTVVRTIYDIPRGDAGNGAAVFTLACSACHGNMHDGLGRLSSRIPVLPEDTLAAHASYSPSGQRQVFIEKVRHGGFLGYGGDMPPFSLEALSDDDLSDLLEALGVLGS
ncbi:MAG TPA: c-type cytochrome [Polyangia bacterium]|nr:c-type cytochrome [Polyangia bacterium]